MSSPIRSVSLSRVNNTRSEEDAQRFQEFLQQDIFLRMLQLERKRAERSGRAFVLMLLKSTKLLRGESAATLHKVMSALANATRDTDTKGWYREHAAVGVIFTELGPDTDGKSVAGALLTKVTTALSSSLSINEINEVGISFRVFPEDWGGGSGDDVESSFYEDLFQECKEERLSKVIKRSIDIAGSLAALTLGAPVFAAIALAVKVTSPGPVFFRQERLGQYGRRFQFLKFRSMQVANDDTAHREFVKQLIANGDGTNGTGSQPQYKIVNDRRITRIGQFLRRSSLDELPQFVNVLKGEMSLVGPRPPIPYEVGLYHVWHRARLLAAKPGITGLWQVMGRSRVKFDDMVRMDLRYASSWSIWLDIKILLQTPRAVFSGNGAR